MASNLHTTSQSKDIWKDICEGVNPLLMQEMDEDDKKDNHGYVILLFILSCLK